MKQKCLDLKQQLERLENELIQYFEDHLTFEGSFITSKPNRPMAWRSYFVYDNKFVFIQNGCWDDDIELYDLYENDKLIKRDVSLKFDSLVDCLL